MWHYVDILRHALGKQYVGQTADVHSRLQEHNEGKNQWTRNNRPFSHVYYEEYIDETFAKKREKFFNSGNGREVLKKKLSHLFPCSSVR